MDHIYQKYREQVDEDALRQHLQLMSAPAWESDLMKVALPKVNMICSSALELYRWHFVLFNALYKLADEFRSNNMYLYVHFMKTTLQPFPASDLCRFFNHDICRFCAAPVTGTSVYCQFHASRLDDSALGAVSDKFFYADTTNFYALTQDSAEKFIAGAWNLLQNQDEHLRCWKIIGLPVNSDLKLVKQRFRQLAQECHPDIYPDRAQQFVKLNSAYRRIISAIIKFD